MLLLGAKIKCKELLVDDSGVAFAFTLTICLLLFLLIVSVPVFGYTIRQKIELQQAVDNAVYAGAVAQADVLSRIAVLNRALAWTYVQTNRRHTDYIMNRYLDDACQAFAACAANAYKAHENATSSYDHRARLQGATGAATCDEQIDRYGWQHYYGVSAPKEYTHYTSFGEDGPYDYIQHGNLLVNGRLVLSGAYLMRQAQTGGNQWSALAEPIKTGSQNIQIMNSEINRLITNLPTIINQAASRVFHTNNTVSYFTILIGSAEADSANMSGLFQLPDTETNFLARHYFSSTQSNYNADNWCSLAWWPAATDNGFYHQLSQILNMRWQGYFYWWHCYSHQHYQEPAPAPPLLAGAADCIIVGDQKSTFRPFDADTDTVWWDDPVAQGTSALWGRSQVGTPKILVRDFFGKAGTIVVGAKRAIENPFSSFEGGTVGLFGRFGLAFDQWAVAAARAGVRAPGNETGAYDTTWNNEANWNLFVDDWDAVMLPLAKAWKKGNAGIWTAPDDSSEKSDAAAILNQVKEKLVPATFPDQPEEVNKDVWH